MVSAHIIVCQLFLLFAGLLALPLQAEPVRRYQACIALIAEMREIVRSRAIAGQETSASESEAVAVIRALRHEILAGGGLSSPTHAFAEANDSDSISTIQKSLRRLWGLEIDFKGEVEGRKEESPRTMFVADRVVGLAQIDAFFHSLRSTLSEVRRVDQDLQNTNPFGLWSDSFYLLQGGLFTAFSAFTAATIPLAAQNPNLLPMIAPLYALIFGGSTILGPETLIRMARDIDRSLVGQWERFGNERPLWAAGARNFVIPKMYFQAAYTHGSVDHALLALRPWMNKTFVERNIRASFLPNSAEHFNTYTLYFDWIFLSGPMSSRIGKGEESQLIFTMRVGPVDSKYYPTRRAPDRVVVQVPKAVYSPSP